MFEMSSRTDVSELLNHAETEPSDPQQRFLDEVEIAMCPENERVEALEDTVVSYAVRVECELDLLDAELGGYVIHG